MHTSSCQFDGARGCVRSLWLRTRCKCRSTTVDGVAPSSQWYRSWRHELTVDEACCFQRGHSMFPRPAVVWRVAHAGPCVSSRRRVHRHTRFDSVWYMPDHCRCQSASRSGVGNSDTYVQSRASLNSRRDDAGCSWRESAIAATLTRARADAQSASSQWSRWSTRHDQRAGGATMMCVSVL
jgi:hypothetical protein